MVSEAVDSEVVLEAVPAAVQVVEPVQLPI